MANNLLNHTLKCPKCKQFFYSYDGSEMCDICFNTNEYELIPKDFKDDKVEANGEQSKSE